jgi:3-hydroxymyristoyl/3-hydroxydecanoyl-(acyl carrier protein) dehydratase
MNATIEVPSAGAWFEGHFPGHPILPGVAELALVMDALARKAGHPVSLQGIAFARLRQLVLPGDRLELTARELIARDSEAARLRIDLKRDGVLVANGEFILGTPQACGDETTASMASTMQDASVPRLDDLLPHRPPMRFLTAILQETAIGLTCTARIPARCALVSGGNAPPVAAIEAAAQAAAAWEALRRWRDAGHAAPRIGYLVALREMIFFTDRVPADRDLQVSVSLEAAAPPLTHYRVEVTLEGMPVTRGTIATFLADDRT